MKAARRLPICCSALEQFEKDYVRPKEGRTLIAGSKVYGDKEDRRHLFSDVVGVDMLEGEGVDVVMDLEDGAPEGSFAHVECLSVLEHSRRPWLLAANLERALEQGGTLYVTVPFVHPVHSYPSDYFRMTIEGVKSLFREIEWSAAFYTNQAIDEKVRRIKYDGFPYFPRTHVAAFGTKA